MWNKLKALFKKKKEPKTFTLYSCHIPVWGDWYEYKVEADSKEDAITALVGYLNFNMPKADYKVTSNHGTVSFPARDVNLTNLPMAVHLGISGERLNDKQWKEYQNWKEKARKKFGTAITACLALLCSCTTTIKEADVVGLKKDVDTVRAVGNVIGLITAPDDCVYVMAYNEAFPEALSIAHSPTCLNSRHAPVATIPLTTVR